MADVFSQAGLATFLSVHTSTGAGMKQARLPGRRPRNPERVEPDKRFEQPPGAELVVWDV